MEQSDKIITNFFSNIIPNIIKPISNSITMLILIFIVIAIFEFLILKAKKRFKDLFLFSLIFGDAFFVIGLWLFNVAGNIGGYCFTGAGLLMLILFNFGQTNGMQINGRPFKYDNETEEEWRERINNNFLKGQEQLNKFFGSNFSNKHKCSFCGTVFDKNRIDCPNCGQIINGNE